MIDGHRAPEVLPDMDLLKDVTDRLTAAGIGFGIYSGFHAMALAGHRSASDVDLWADEQRLADIGAAFPEANVRQAWQGSGEVTVPSEHTGFAINLGDGTVSILGASAIRISDEIYPTNFAGVRDRISWQDFGWVANYFVDPVDTLLNKALTQRGREQGKHDIDDILAIHGAVEIDTAYLYRRIDQLGAHDRVVPFLRRLGVL